MRSLSQGIAIGKVTNNSDPDRPGKVEVLLASSGENSPKRWCSVLSVSAGNDSGIFFMPEVDDEVIVAFDQANFEHAFIIGYPWNPVQMPPTTAPNERMIRSREGHTIRFIDTEENGGDHGALIIQDAHENVITMANGIVTINAKNHLNINASSMNIMNRRVDPLGGII